MKRERQNLVLGTAGHIDHGKTSLLQKLTGINADRLKEEQERGITIDIGFAHWDDPPYTIGFIDVPGHERFIKNMLAGAGGIDGLLLVVAADEGVMPQTREHFEIACLLGIRAGIIVLNKMDLVEADYAGLVEEDVRRLVAGSFLEKAPLVRVSAVTGEGIPELKTLLRKMADERQEMALHTIPRLFIDRVFILRGQGVVVTGTVRSGTIRKNETVQVLPPGYVVKIRQIQAYGRELPEVSAGSRAAFNLAGVELDQLQRGMVLTPPAGSSTTNMFNARFRLLKSFGKRLRNRLPVHVYHGSAEMLGRLEFMETERMEPGEESLVQIRLESPALVWPGDHFVIRQYSPLVTMGGGIILENHPPRFQRRTRDELIPLLKNLRVEDEPCRVRHTMIRYGRHGLTLDELENHTAIPEQRLVDILTRLTGAEACLPLSADRRNWICRSYLLQMEKQLLQGMERFFSDNPDSPGMKRGELRKLLPAIPDQVIDLLMGAMIRDEKLRQQEDRYLPPGKGTLPEPGIDPQLQALVEQLTAAGLEGWDENTLKRHLFAGGKHNPSRLDLILQKRLVIRVTTDYFITPAIFQQVVDTLRSRLQKGDTLEISQIKEWFGLTRKRLIPLLEYLDRQSITLRIGNDRRLR